MKKTTLFGCFAVTVAMIFSTGCAIEEPEKVVATYSGRSTGFGGDISVTISVGDKGNILKVESTGEKETESIGGAALKTLDDAFLNANDTNFDMVAGATKTSIGYKGAAEKAYIEWKGYGSTYDLKRMRALAIVNGVPGQITYFSPSEAKNIGLDPIDEYKMSELALDGEHFDAMVVEGVNDGKSSEYPLLLSTNSKHSEMTSSSDELVSSAKTAVINSFSDIYPNLKFYDGKSCYYMYGSPNGFGSGADRINVYYLRANSDGKDILVEAMVGFTGVSRRAIQLSVYEKQ